MVFTFCPECKTQVTAEVDDTNGFTCCTSCGHVLDETVFSTDPTFSKAPGGVSTVDGNFVPDSGVAPGAGRSRGQRVFGYQVDSHEKTIAKGKHEIANVADRLGIRPREEMTAAAHRLYKLAVQRNFTRGRRTQQVAGACLYIVCRQEGRPYMLIDFSDVLQTNVYVLGSVFLQLGRLLRLENHPIMQRPVDPSLFIHRFADRLDLGRKANAVANTALRLVAVMKRDWMQTGRRPSGVCGAALFIAAHIHGLARAKREVVSVVHVCEATLRKRLNEFQDTHSSNLTIDEFDKRAEELDNDLKNISQSKAEPGQVQCEHQDQPHVMHFANGMCISCYEQYLKVSGGVRGGDDPPAYKRAKKKSEARRKQKEAEALAASEAAVATNIVETELTIMEAELAREEIRGLATGALPSSQLPSSLAVARTAVVDDGQESMLPAPTVEDALAQAGVPMKKPKDEAPAQEAQEIDTLSDIDDDEIGLYINTEEEMKVKEAVWTQLNQEYLQEQEAKQAAAASTEPVAAAKGKKSVSFAPGVGGETSKEGGEDGKGGAGAAAGDGAEAGARKRKAGAGGEATPLLTGQMDPATEKISQTLNKRRASSKINYSALNNLFQKSPASAPTSRVGGLAQKQKNAGGAGMETAAATKKGDQRARRPGSLGSGATRVARRSALPFGLPGSAKGAGGLTKGQPSSKEAGLATKRGRLGKVGTSKK